MKIQSKSDIITNSSSEVFIILKSDAEKINKKYKRNGMGIWEMDDDFFWGECEIPSICAVLNIEHKFFDDINDYNDWCQNVVKPVYDRELKDKGYVFVDIDNQAENGWNAMDEAEEVCIYHEDRN